MPTVGVTMNYCSIAVVIHISNVSNFDFLRSDRTYSYHIQHKTHSQ